MSLERESSLHPLKSSRPLNSTPWRPPSSLSTNTPAPTSHFRSSGSSGSSDPRNPATSDSTVNFSSRPTRSLVSFHDALPTFVFRIGTRVTENAVILARDITRQSQKRLPLSLSLSLLSLLRRIRHFWWCSDTESRIRDRDLRNSRHRSIIPFPSVLLCSARFLRKERAHGPVSFRATYPSLL